MVERTEELRRDIEQTREHMSGTLDAIGDRVSPGRIVERKWERVRQSSSSLGQKVMGKPRSAAQSASTTVGGLRSSASDAASGAASSASNMASSAADAVTGAPDMVKDATTGNPLAAGAVAFGLGVLISSIAPPTQQEQQMAEKVMEPLQQELSDAGQQVAGVVKEQAQQAVEETKSVATDAATEVKEHASDAAGQVSEKANEAKGQVQDEAATAAQQVKS